MAQRIVLNPPTISKPLGLYSHGIKVEGAKSVIFLAGQTASDRNGESVGIGDIVAQARQVFENVKAILEQGGATMDDIVKLTIYHVDVGDEINKVNAIRAEYFRGEPPANTRIMVSGFARKEFLIEIEAVAVLG